MRAVQSGVGGDSFCRVPGFIFLTAFLTRPIGTFTYTKGEPYIRVKPLDFLRIAFLRLDSRGGLRLRAGEFV